MTSLKALFFSFDFQNKNQCNKIKYIGRQPAIKRQLSTIENKLVISGLACEIFIKEDRFDCFIN